MINIHCRFGCEEVIGIYSIPEGCLCFPDDKEQALCAQHLYKAESSGPIEKLFDWPPPPKSYAAPKGKIWRCMACGKRSKDKITDVENSGWDESCFLHAELVDDS